MIKQICQIFVQAITMRHVKYSLQQQLIILYFPCYGTMGSLSPFVFFYAFVDIAIRLFATDLSLLIRFSVIEVKQKEVVTVTSVRYSCKTSKTSKTHSNTVLVKKNLRLTVSKDFNGSILVEKIITHRKGPFNDWKCMKIIYTSMWTAVEERIMKVILAVMNTT